MDDAANPLNDDSNFQLPAAFLTRLEEILPAHYSAIQASFSSQRPLVLRCNTHKLDVSEAATTLRQYDLEFSHHPTFQDSFIIPAAQRQQALQSDAYQHGLFYAQGLSSQLAVLALNPQIDEEILDLCAAPGGKTAYISCLMQGSGRIAAVEYNKSRFFKLKNTIQWQQLHNVHAYHKDGIKVWRKVGERFDRVLLDAPCSSEARFQAGKPKTFRHWSKKKITDMAKKQRALAFSAYHCLKPGGRLTYATCSFAPEENEATIDALLKRFGDRLSVESLDFDLANVYPGLNHWQGKNFHPQVTKAIRILPNQLMSGFFICNLRKQGDTT